MSLELGTSFFALAQNFPIEDGVEPDELWLIKLNQLFWKILFLLSSHSPLKNSHQHLCGGGRGKVCKLSHFVWHYTRISHCLIWWRVHICFSACADLLCDWWERLRQNPWFLLTLRWWPNGKPQPRGRGLWCARGQGRWAEQLAEDAEGRSSALRFQEK